MRVDRLADGLWRWTAAEPASGREGNAVYHETPDGIVLIDPLIPVDAADAERFWRALDRDVERIGRPPVVAATVPGRAVGARAVRDRYAGTRIAATAPAPDLAAGDVLADGAELPGGVTVIAADTGLLHCSCHGLLWTADLLDDPIALAPLIAQLTALHLSALMPARGAPVVDDPVGWLAAHAR